MIKKFATLGIFAVIILSSFYFGFSRLKNYSGVDEPYWSYDRVPTFWKSIRAGKWKSTDVSDKPGATTNIVSGAGLPFIDGSPKDYKKLRFQPKTPEQVEFIRDIYFKLRMPIFLFTLLVLPFFYFLIKKLLGTETARYSLIFIGLSPVLLGISLIINSDAILWIVTALSTLSLFVFLKTDEKKYLYLSGFLLGLSVVTKYVANVLFVYFFAIFFLEFILNAHKQSQIGDYLKKSFLNFLTLIAITMATAFVFFPATWVKFSKLINATIGNDVFKSVWPIFVGAIVVLGFDIFLLKSRVSSKVFGWAVNYRTHVSKAIMAIFLLLSAVVFINVYTPIQIFDIQQIIASPKGIGSGNVLQRYGGALTADLFSLFFSISPLILALLLYCAYAILRKKELERDSITAIYIVIFILVFYLGSAVNDVTTTVRYQIMTYPLVFVLAAIGINHLLGNEKIKKVIAPEIGYALSIIVLMASLIGIKPHYLAYASELLPKHLIVNLKGMGEGSIEAANYLNKLPGADKMVIWSDKGAVCEAFVGRCFIDFKKKNMAENKYDYFVVSTDRKSRTLKLSKRNGFVDFKALYEETNPEFEIIIGDRPINFVKVIKGN